MRVSDGRSSPFLIDSFFSVFDFDNELAIFLIYPTKIFMNNTVAEKKPNRVNHQYLLNEKIFLMQKKMKTTNALDCDQFNFSSRIVFLYTFSIWSNLKQHHSIC